MIDIASRVLHPPSYDPEANMAMALMYNGVQYAPVSAKRSIVVPHSAEVLWSVIGKFGKQALWMGTVEGRPIFTQLLGGESADYVGAVRVFGIADKLLFEQLTKLDNQDMIMCWQLTTHPMNSNPFPAAFLNCKASLQVFPVSIPGGQAFTEWRIDLLTEAQHVGHMSKAIDDIMLVGYTNLIKYMNKSMTSSGGHSSGSTTQGGIVGSTVAPSAYGVQFMPQPAAVHTHTQSLSQATQSGPLTGSSAFLQQPTFVPAPGESLAASTPQSQGGLNPSPSVFQQQPMPQHMYSQFQGQQFSGQQQQFPGQQQQFPGQQQHQQQQFAQYPQNPYLFQQQSNSFQSMQMPQHQSQQQQHGLRHSESGISLPDSLRNVHRTQSESDRASQSTLRGGQTQPGGGQPQQGQLAQGTSNVSLHSDQAP